MTRPVGVRTILGACALVSAPPVFSQEAEPTFCEWFENRLIAYADDRSFSFSQEELDTLMMGCDPQAVQAPESSIDMDSLMDSFMEGLRGPDTDIETEAEIQARLEAEAQARRESNDAPTRAYQACLDDGHGVSYCMGRMTRVGIGDAFRERYPNFFWAWDILTRWGLPLFGILFVLGVIMQIIEWVRGSGKSA